MFVIIGYLVLCWFCFFNGYSRDSLLYERKLEDLVRIVVSCIREFGGEMGNGCLRLG